MSFVCLWTPDWQTDEASLAELAAALLREAPRVAVDPRGVIWADGRGLDGGWLARALLELLAERGWPGARVGVAAVPVVAELAARAGASEVTVVRAGHERGFVAPLSLELLEPDPPLRGLLEGVGVETLGELATLEREAVEVRFGAAGLALWRLARADDPRRLFGPMPQLAPHASLEFVEYEIRDTERLAFPLNALLETICEGLRARAERAGSLVLELPLSDGESWSRTVRAALPTSDRGFWSRRIRAVLEGVRLHCGAVGISLRTGTTEPSAAVQGDLFDRGFATASAVEAAVARLSETHGTLIMEPSVTGHPLLERRTEWRPVELGRVTERPTGVEGEPPCLTLQMLPEPRPIEVRMRSRRDHTLPVRFRDGRRWTPLTTAAGPDRISGGHWEERPYAREYFRCVTNDGRLVWLFRDAMADAWYLQGWWD